MPSNGDKNSCREPWPVFFSSSGALGTKDGGVATGNIVQNAISKANAERVSIFTQWLSEA
ncbi:hypothetical protein EAE99_002773 [Botrytis elliptica]|nr:hypothetical protein EAE99_002773 [Botrytis elliptica]